jgi:hypothetical protein
MTYYNDDRGIPLLFWSLFVLIVGVPVFLIILDYLRH